MSRLGRVLAWLFPSCNASLENQVRIFTAMEGFPSTPSPAPGVRGEANPGAGQAPAPVTSTPAGAGQTTVAPTFHGDGGRGPGADAIRPGPDQGGDSA